VKAQGGWAALLIILVLTAATAARGDDGARTVLLRRTDGGGAIHYAENVHAIPAEFKSGAVQGRVGNGFVYPIRYVKVTVHFLDDAPAFVRAESAYADPIELQPGEEGIYTIVARSQPEITRCEPEFAWRK
jgi:hypothetical protein